LICSERRTAWRVIRPGAARGSTKYKREKIMPKRIALLATVAALAVTPALAQQSPSPSQTQPAPQAQPAPSTQPDSMKPGEGMKSAQPSGAGKSFVDTQTADQWSASKVIGLRVLGNGDENIGSISDLLLTDDGRIVAVVIGVGGFLGIGQKDVAITFDTVDIVRDADGNEQAKLSMTKEQLQNAPAFKAYEPPRPARTNSPTAPKKPSGM
jgi:hypothetical protein